MSDRQIDAEFDAILDARLRAAAIDDAAVARLPLSPALPGLLEEIMRTPAPLTVSEAAPQTTPAPVSTRRPTRRMRLVLAAAAAAAAVLVGTVAMPDGGGSTAFAAELVAVAEANERILVDAEGWKVSRVDEFTAAYGEMTFSDGTRSLNLHWAPAAGYAERFAKHEREFGKGSSVPVLGQQARMFPYGGTEYETLLPPDGGTYVRIRGDVGDEAGYRALLADLHSVDVKTWLSALPSSAVQPGRQADTIAAMLQGLPLPPGFDRGAIDAGEGVRDRYQLGAAVAGAVSCSWVEHWATGDATAKQEAIAAMRTSTTWPVLQDMDAEGAYPEAVAEVAPALAGEETPNAQKGGDVVAALQGLLGCR